MRFSCAAVLSGLVLTLMIGTAWSMPPSFDGLAGVPMGPEFQRRAMCEDPEIRKMMKDAGLDHKCKDDEGGLHLHLHQHERDARVPCRITRVVNGVPVSSHVEMRRYQDCLPGRL
jgi:hypothetical protein